MDDLERKRWENSDSAEQHPPRRALLAVADDIEKGRLMKVKHVLVVVVEETEDGSDLVSIVQAGELTTLAAEGALFRACKLIGSVSFD